MTFIGLLDTRTKNNGLMKLQFCSSQTDTDQTMRIPYDTLAVTSVSYAYTLLLLVILFTSAYLFKQLNASRNKCFIRGNCVAKFCVKLSLTP